MKKILARYTSKKYSIAFLTAAFFLLFISGVAFRQIQSMNKAQEMVIHTYSVKNEMIQMYQFLRSAESSQRGYLLTGDSMYLNSYIGNKARIDSMTQNVQTLIYDNEQQKQRLNNIIQLTQHRYKIMEEVLNDDRNKNITILDTLRLKMNNGFYTMEKLRDEVIAFNEEENRLLQTRTHVRNQKTKYAPLLMFSVVLFSLVVFVFSYFRINKDFSRLKHVYDDLMMKDISHNQAEVIAGLGNWQYDVNNAIFTISDNYYNLIGAKKGMYNPTFENFMSSIHPDDYGYVEENAHRCLGGEPAFELYYRYYKKDTKELRYFRTVSRNVINSTGQLITLGINQDITDSVMNNLQLAEQNKHLLNANYELSSFNYVASHDLQEPLRKIQMFISRISSDKDNQFSDKSQDFFKKVQESAARMQVLISDLLQYSRITRNERIFETVNLNDTVQEAWSELGAAVDDKQATLDVEELPQVSGVPFQLRQLFSNLIGNSLKYTDASRKPHINISSEWVIGEHLSFPHVKKESKYLRIAVRDNGIGFEQQYAEKIFTLFQRLHDRNSYSGTGIGLSICKKIMDNHNGFIEAKGYPGEGAVFIIYIPANSKLL